MSKIVFAMFTFLTVGASYMTVYSVGVSEPSIENAREGSTHRGMRGIGRGHYGK